jgi:hypothetical protein
MPIRPSVWIAALPALVLACGSTFEASSDPGSDSGGEADAAPLDSTAREASHSVDATSDLSAVDTSVGDTGVSDTGHSADTGPVDTGAADSRPADTGAETGPKDTGAPDACPRTCSDMVCPVGEHCCGSIEIHGCASCTVGTGDICPG